MEKKIKVTNQFKGEKTLKEVLKELVILKIKNK
jgi:hypothetical protein